MATNKPISGFPTISASTLQPGVLLVLDDVTDTSSAPTGTTKSVTLSSLLGNPNNGPVIGVLTPIRGTPAAGTIVKTALNGMVAQSSGGSSTEFMWKASNGTTVAYIDDAGRLVVPSSVVANTFQGGTTQPAATKSAGTATVTALKVVGGSGGASGNDAGGIVIWTVTGTGSWTIRITFTASYTTVPAVVISAADAVLPTLSPYVSVQSADYFEVTGSNFASTGAYSFNYVVMQ